MNKIFKGNNSLAELKTELLKHQELQGIDVKDSDVLMLINYFESYSKCDKCKGLSFCKQETNGYKPLLIKGLKVVYEECKYKKEELLKQKKNSLIKALYLPKKILEANLKDFRLDSDNRRKCMEYVEKFLLEFPKGNYLEGMFINGEFGSGKTYLLAALANELALKDIETLMIYFPDLVRDIKSGINKNTVEDKINMLKEVKVLMLDDFGSENMTPWLRDEILGPILQYRFLEELPTFFSSNLDAKQLLEHLSIDDLKKGARIAKRIQTIAKNFKL